jgi:hypothetical protein
MFGTSKLFFFNSENKKSKKNEDVQKQKSIIDSKVRLKIKSCSSSSNLPIYTKT